MLSEIIVVYYYWCGILFERQKDIMAPKPNHA